MNIDEIRVLLTDSAQFFLEVKFTYSFHIGNILNISNNYMEIFG